MAEKTNVGMTVYIAHITSMCGLGSDGVAARLSAAAAISLSSSVSRCCFRALHRFVPSAARPSLRASIIILYNERFQYWFATSALIR